MADMADTVTIFTRRGLAAQAKRNVRHLQSQAGGAKRGDLISRYRRTWRVATVVSSTVLRIASFVFLRWIPGHHLVPTILLSLILYLTSFTLSARPLPPPSPEDVISDRYTAAYERLQQNRRRRDTEEFLRWQRDDEGLRRRQGPSINEPALSSESPASQASPPGSPLMRSLDLSKSSHSMLSMFPTPPRSILSLSSNPDTTPKGKSTRSSKGLPCASDTSPAGVTETIALGLPNPASRLWSLSTLMINVLLALMAFDLVFRAPLLHPSHDLAFARTGFVDEKSARVLVREPDVAQMPLSISYRTSESGRWTTTKKVAAVGEDWDFTHAFTLPHLKAATKYEYVTSNGHNGTFTTAPKIGYPRVTFLSSSCLKPRVPYNIFLHPLQMPGLDALATLLPKVRASFMLFLGDFIYVDVPWRLGWQASNYRREYRQVYASSSWQKVSQSLSWVHVIDDHEIANDWDQGSSAAPYPAAIDPYSIYHHSVNPPAAALNESFYTFRHGPASFFLIDTRKHRTPSVPLPATHPNKTILGASQRQALLQWFAQPEPRGVKWKFLVSSVPLTRNWRANAMDTWGGYLAERQMVLEAMWDAAAKGYGVVALSGDRHEFAATRFPAPLGDDGQREIEKKAKSKSEAEKLKNARSRWGLTSENGNRWRHQQTGEPVSVYEFSCSPLSMFYLPIRTYREKIGEESGVGAGGEDQKIVYIAVGNSKVGAVDIGLEADDKGREQSVMRYRLFVDGKERWAYGVSVDGREGIEVGANMFDEEM